MALNDALARVGITGSVYTAPLGTAGPAATDWFQAWPTGWLDLGYIGDGGLTEGRNEDRQEWTPWQSDTPIRTQVTSATKTFQFQCWETNGPVVALYYQVTTAGMTTGATLNAGAVSFNDVGRPAPQRRAFGFDSVDGTNVRRFWVPSGEITARGDITYVTSDLVRYDFTVTAYAGADGIAVKRFFKEGWTIPTGF